MNRVVMDASAFLTLLNREPGYELVEQYLPQSIISAVNLSEVLSVLLNIGIALEKAEFAVMPLIKEVVPFQKNHAIEAANLRHVTKAFGLSLGDRACLALAKIEKIPTLTADKAWSKIDHGVEVISIR